ncbi:MAG: hypothetical protein QNJ55_25500 [Xenococcus sp. MO_188.B8]|nr:hypothetical protein [Xenococcus sp. MO_188.B8]
MRIYLYLLAGITSALIGWNIGQFFIADIGLFNQAPEIILFPCIAISLAIGMVINEIFISTPTRPKLSFRIIRIPIIIATGLGLIAGLIAGSISQVLFLPEIPVPAAIVRMLGWLLIGSSVGLAEGLTWWWHSMEAGDPKRFQRRFKTSISAASGASLIAAFLFELIRILVQLISDGGVSKGFRALEDPLGFSLLGLLLGLAFSITNSPSYMAALRAGAGFEYEDKGNYFVDDDLPITDEDDNYPRIDQKLLKFVSNSEEDKIEEGLSIQLPPTGKITIGSGEDDQIYIPELPPQLATLMLEHRKTLLIPNSKFYRKIKVNGYLLNSRKKILLKHNFVVAFHTSKKDEFDEPKIYRFVYYNRFLDPQA